MTAWRDYAHAASIELRLRGWDKDEPQPCAEAEEFAIMDELAGRLGMDWDNAASLLSENTTSYDDEESDARDYARRLTDAQLLAALGRMIECHRADQLRARAKMAVAAFIAALFVKVPA